MTELLLLLLLLTLNNSRRSAVIAIRNTFPQLTRKSSPFVQHFQHSSAPDKLVPVTMTWRVLRLRMEERPPIWRVAANILNKQSRTADKG